MQLGVFIPIGNNGWLISTNSPQYKPSFDLNKTIVEKAPSAVTALGRLKQARDYVKQTVAAAFRKLRDAGRTLTAGRINRVVHDALKATFEVFEGYAE